MRHSGVFTAVAVPLVLVFLQPTGAQFNFQMDARNTIPDTILGCYENATAVNRYNRLPMHIDNLIAIIRKIEDKTDQQWDIRRISRTLVHRFMFDGMQFYPESKPDLRYRQKPYERAKSLVIKELIPMPNEDSFPDGILDNDERCALHWMLSHSLNATLRYEEQDLPGGTSGGYPGYGSGSNNGGYPYNNNNNNNNGYNNNNNNNNGFINNNNGYNPNQGNNNMDSNRYRGKRSASDEADIEKSGEEYSEDDYDVMEKNSSPSSLTLAPKSLSAKSSDESDDADFETIPVADEPTVSSGTSKLAKQVSETPERTRTKQPVETGVVYTKWGAVNGGRLISGIAAGLQATRMSANGGNVYLPPSNPGGTNPWSGGSGLSNANNQWGSGMGNNPPFKSVNSNNNNGQGYPSQYPNQQQPQANQWGRRKKRQVGNVAPLDSIYVATLAGDAGQAAILNGPNLITASGLPTGVFNDTICPREYVLYENGNNQYYKDTSAWTYLTEAEVRGGVDGLVLGLNILKWDPSATLRLSDILSEYYSEAGISKENNFRACDRSALLSQFVNMNEVKEQTRSFAYRYNNMTNQISDQMIGQRPGLFEDLVNEAYDKMSRQAASFSGIGPCQPRGGSDYNDEQKIMVPKLTLYAVLDHSGNTEELDQQKRFLGQLVYELNVSPTGSRLGVLDGNSGNIIISPNWTDTSSILGCRILSLQNQLKMQDYSRVLTSMKSELERVKSQELMNNYTLSNGKVILFMIQGRKLEENQRDEIVRLTREINREVSDVSVIVTSSKFNENELNFDDYKEIRYVKLQQSSNGNFSDMADEFSKDLLRNTHGSLSYIQCDPKTYSQDQEHLIAHNLYIFPNTIEYYKISPDYFHSGRSIILRFTSDNGKVRVCMSRKEWYPNANKVGDGNNKIWCNETTGNYISVGRAEKDVEFRGSELERPCGKSGKKEGCDPIYLSFTPIEVRGPGQIGLDCSQEGQGCVSSSQVKVTFTHWGLRCNSGVRTVLSSTIAIFTVTLALFNWLKLT